MRSHAPLGLTQLPDQLEKDQSPVGMAYTWQGIVDDPIQENGTLALCTEIQQKRMPTAFRARHLPLAITPETEFASIAPWLECSYP